MINAKINKKESKPKCKYPYLGIYKDELVVLFSEEKTGVVVVGDGRANKIAYYSRDWAEEVFTPLKGEIVLTNE